MGESAGQVKGIDDWKKQVLCFLAGSSGGETERKQVALVNKAQQCTVDVFILGGVGAKQVSCIFIFKVGQAGFLYDLAAILFDG